MAKRNLRNSNKPVSTTSSRECYLRARSDTYMTSLSNWNEE